jgi:protein involved in ribonucleotide reduction
MRSVNDLIECKGELKQSVFLITHTIKRGMVTKATQEFLNRYAGNTIGVCVSGDQRWGQLFGLAGDKIHLEYDIPLVRKIDLRGYPSDIEAVASWIQNWTEKLEKNV